MRIAFWPMMLAWTVLSGCTVGPDYVAIPPQVPERWSESLPQDRSGDPAGWWQGFHDPALDHLLATVRDANLDLKIARQRVISAREDRVGIAARDLPQVSAGVSETLMRTSPNVQWPPGMGESKTHQIGLEAAWEIDVFGGNRRALEAADAAIAMTQEDGNAIMVGLLAEAASDYMTLTAAQVRLDIARRNIATQQQTLELTRQAFTAGVGRDVDVMRARAAVAMSQAQMPVLTAIVARMTHALAILSGGFPGDWTDQGPPGTTRLPPPPPLPATMPSDVVRNRPDIRKAERRIAATTAQVGVATAELFPHFSIPLSLGAAASNLENLLLAHSLIWTMGAQAGQVIYDGDRRQAHLRAVEAVVEADRLAYQQSIRVAFRDVEDSLANLSTERQRLVSLQSAAQDERQALGRTSRLYANGLADFLKVLDSQRAVFQVDDAVVQSQLAEILDVIAFYKAIGGGWQEAG